MTLDEAIEHAKQVARTCNDNQCAAEHIQLAEWLRTARGAEAAGRWHTAKVRELEAENAKLRELLLDVWHLFTEHGAVHPCDLPVVDAVRDRMRELGVEVD